VFKELGLIEQWGSRISRIKSSCLEVGLKEPKIREINDFVDVEFYRLDNQTVVKSSDNLMPQETKIIQYLDEHKRVVSKEVEKLLSIKESRTRELLKNMVDKGLIERIGAGRSTCYILKGKQK